MPRFEPAPAEVRQIIERMTDRFHPQLRDAKVKIDALLAFATTDEFGDRKGHAVKLNGYPCAAVVRVLNLKDRTKGLGDAEILIDGDDWPTLSEQEKDALIDHEIEHLELKTDKDGLVVRDDLDRPKLRIRKHDWQFGWFDAIARRHGHASFEVKQHEAFLEKHRQLWLPFIESPDQTPVVAERVTPEDDAEEELLPIHGGKDKPKAPKKKKAARGRGLSRAAGGK